MGPVRGHRVVAGVDEEALPRAPAAAVEVEVVHEHHRGSVQDALDVRDVGEVVLDPLRFLGESEWGEPEHGPPYNVRV